MAVLSLVSERIGKIALSYPHLLRSLRSDLMSHSQRNFDLIQLRNDPPWTFSPETKVTLPGAHGSEIVRAFCFLDEVGEMNKHSFWKITDGNIA